MTWKPRLILVKVYTSRGYGCGIYNTLIFVESKALKQAHRAEVQEELLWLCEAAHVPVIWATQVLESIFNR
jgi:hypothetical protein